MARTRRAQILMEPDEYRRLETIAERTGVSVAHLIREAVRERYLLTQERRREIVDDILSMKIPIEGSWREWEEEVMDAADDGVH